jgi:autotransporter-associated beta strand protein
MKTSNLSKREVPPNQQTSPCCLSWLRATTISLLTFTLLGGSAQAATRTWDGGGGDANWGTIFNWDGNVSIPATTDDATFGTGFGSGTTISLNGDRTVNSLTIDTSVGITIANNTLTLTAGSLTRNSTASGDQIISSVVTLGANAVWNIQGAGTLTVSGRIFESGGGTSLTKSGSGTLIVGSSAGQNFYTGGTTLSGGTLRLGDNDALGPGGFRFGGGILNANNKSDFDIGVLTLTASSTLNLAADSTPGFLNFSSASGWTGGTLLTINGWSGTAGAAGTDDRIFMQANPGATILGQINFTGYAPGAAWVGSEIVPAVPEPVNVALGVFGVVFAGFGFARRLHARHQAVR